MKEVVKHASTNFLDSAAFSGKLWNRKWESFVEYSNAPLTSTIKVSSDDHHNAVVAGSSLLYGELLPQSVTELAARHLLGYNSCTFDGQPLNVFELGFGYGKVALQIFFQFPSTVKSVIATELSSTRFSWTVSKFKNIFSAIKDPCYSTELRDGEMQVSQKNRQLVLRKGDLFQVKDVETADVVFLMVELHIERWGQYQKLKRLIQRLKPGCRIISYNKLPMERLNIVTMQHFRTSWSRDRGAYLGVYTVAP